MNNHLLRLFGEILGFVLILGLDRLTIAAQVVSPAQTDSGALPGGPANLSPPPIPPPPPPALHPPPMPDDLGSPPMPFRVVGPGVFELGEVRMDKRQRMVSFPAVLNMNQGLMEYFLVTAYGKTHESILRTGAQPYHIHVAMLLLDAKGSGTNSLSGNPTQNGPEDKAPVQGRAQQITNPSKAIIPGDKITIEVSWRVDDKEIRHSAEDLVFNREANAVQSKGHWVYNGSQVLGGRFFAQMDGSVVSLVTDPGALINNVGAGHDNDHIWTVNTNSLPPWNTPVQVTIKLESPQPNR